ncbi:MAG TPA: prepilin-type N-terminal cleavage/methylation domain-containing protein [Candidatus Saccharimonadia bacterium]|nr:prepilin-type N-terminal cleavage/methylation domain-containing protein [Candidatus Saccharimonadia bacterium]
MKKLHIHQYQSGYTLIELILYVAILGILLTATVGFFGMIADARVKSQTISEVNDQGTFAIDYLTQTVRNATSITTPLTSTSGSSLTLVVPTASLSPTIFSLSGTTLQVQEGAGAAVALTNSKVQVTNFTVKNLTRSGTSGIVQISITLSRVNTAGRNEYDYTQTFTTSAAVRP